MSTHVTQNTAPSTETSTEPKKFKVYPSSAAFMQGSQVSTKSNKSCHRYIWTQTHAFDGQRTPNSVAPEYGALGTLNEWQFARRLELGEIRADREVEFKMDFKTIAISGRQDFVEHGGVIWEVKSVTSESKKKSVFDEGQPDPSWVAQLASYMSFLKKPEGRIYAAYWELEDDGENFGFRKVTERVFIVKSLDNGVLTVDGAPFQHSLRDLARWFSELEKNSSRTSTPPQRPCQPVNKYQSPCNYCPLSKTCDKLDQGGMDVAEYLTEAKDAILTQKINPFKIKILTSRRKKLQETKAKKKDAKARATPDGQDPTP